MTARINDKAHVVYTGRKFAIKIGIIVGAAFLYSHLANVE